MKALRGLFAAQCFRQVTIRAGPSRRFVLEPVSLAQLHGGERALASKALIGRRSASAREAIGKGDRAGSGAGGGATFEASLAIARSSRLRDPRRDADLFEVGFSRVRQDVRVDLMLPEHRFVQSKADRVQPLGDVHVGAASAETSVSSPRWRMESRTSVTGAQWGVPPDALSVAASRV